MVQHATYDKSVEVGGYLSKPLSITYGVPQRSDLGPRLLLFYINDMRAACKFCVFIYCYPGVP